MIDAVLSYHANPDTCGVTKFNIQLADKLGVPHGVLTELGGMHAVRNAVHPLLSLKASELDPVVGFAWKTPYDLLWHDTGTPDLGNLTMQADRVFYATDTGCPSTLRGNASRPGLTVLSFGMAHKFQQPSYDRLKTLLDRRELPYTVCVSSAVHEGHPWDVTTAENERLMRGVFGDHLRFLGFLADDALAREIRDAHMIALFYEPAVRANNTTLWAALEAGTPVITNLDGQSPKELIHWRSVFDLAQLAEWPDAPICREVRYGGREAAKVYSWDRVVAMLQAPVRV